MMKKKIMIVEDEIIAALALGQVLTRQNYEVCDYVSSGEAAVAAAHKERPDLILMDINIRGSLNGIEAARQIRAETGIPLVFITGYSDDRLLAEAQTIKPAAILDKPLDPVRVLEVIAATLA